MKNAGIILMVIGGALVLSGLKLGLTKYHLSNTHDLSKFFGGLGLSILVFSFGAALFFADKKKKTNLPTTPRTSPPPIPKSTDEE